jgi:hypothetical protein
MYVSGVSGDMIFEWRGRTYHFLYIHPALSILHKSLLVLSLLALFDCALQDPDQGFSDEAFSIIYDRVTASSTLAFDDTTTVTTSAMTGGVCTDWRWRHDLTVEGETAHSWEDCSSHIVRYSKN